MKYIDFEKLIAEIMALKKKYGSCVVRNEVEQCFKDGRLIGYEDALNKINKLQQEQPFPCWIHANYSDKPEIRYSPSGNPYLQSGSYMIWLSDLETLPKDGTDLTNSGPKQPEVDLEKEIVENLGDDVWNDTSIRI